MRNFVIDNVEIASIIEMQDGTREESVFVEQDVEHEIQAESMSEALAGFLRRFESAEPPCMVASCTIMDVTTVELLAIRAAGRQARATK